MRLWRLCLKNGGDYNSLAEGREIKKNSLRVEITIRLCLKGASKPVAAGRGGRFLPSTLQMWGKKQSQF